MKNRLLITFSVCAILISAACLLGSVMYYRKAEKAMEDSQKKMETMEKDLTSEIDNLKQSLEKVRQDQLRQEAEEDRGEADTEASTEKKQKKKDKAGEKTEDKTEGRSAIKIALDPGHQSERIDMSDMEPNGPGSDQMKRKATGGATGDYTGVPEYQLNLDISLMVRDRLEKKGYQVLMTREDNDTAISNKERAQLANEEGADIAVRIHANSDDSHKASGALALIGSADNPYVSNLYTESHRLADEVLSAYCKKTGMKNKGIVENDTMTGINWSEIPVIILEMGFMSNENDDRNMQKKDYQKKMADGITEGIDHYFGY